MTGDPLRVRTPDLDVVDEMTPTVACYALAAHRRGDPTALRDFLALYGARGRLALHLTPAGAALRRAASLYPDRNLSKDPR